MSWYEDLTGFISNNKGILKPLAIVGSGLYQNSSQDNSREEYINYRKAQEDKNYQNSIDAANTANANSAANAANARARAAASNANAAASRSAAMQTQKNAQKAAAKGNKAQQKGYEQALAMFAPYLEAGKQIVPAKTQTYLEALKSAAALQTSLNTPDISTPAFQMAVKPKGY